MIVTTGTWRLNDNELVTVRRVIAVEAPDSTQHRRPARGFVLPQPLDQRTVDRHPVGSVRIPRSRPSASATAPSRARRFLAVRRPLQEFAVALANPDPFDRNQWALQ